MLDEASMLFSARKFSTSCTGAYTAEIGAALIENTVNSMGMDFPPKRVRLDGVSCHESCLNNTTFVFRFDGLGPDVGFTKFQFSQPMSNPVHSGN